jgi:5-methylcytosine-specific restriction endonuclease McrA
MSVHRHRLSNVDPLTKTATCAVCGPVAILRHQTTWRCRTAKRARKYVSPEAKARRILKGREYAREKRKPYRVALDTKCARCGFVAEHPCQLDIDHIDEDHTNDAPANLQTLCANCHRLKTWRACHNEQGEFVGYAAWTRKGRRGSKNYAPLP